MASVYQKNGVWYLSLKDARDNWIAKRSGARTKTEAKRLAVELQAQCDRQRMGLDPIVGSDGGGTLAELMQWWLELKGGANPSLSQQACASMVRRHIIGSPLGQMTLAAVQSSDIATFLFSKNASLKAQSINHLRAYIRAAYNCAAERKRWTGPNPIRGTKRTAQCRAQPDYLRPHEIPLVLAALPDRWRPLFATAIYTGLRKGELFALRKSDVDLDLRLLTVARSHGRDTTKGGHADSIPIAAELVPFLHRAMQASATQLVFPTPDGRRWREDTDLANVLRHALARAGIVTGYRHVCRRRGCGHAEQAADATLRRCPTDGRKLWPKAEVRPIRFHDLRHTTASLLMMGGANPAAVQRILRHRDPRITTEIYGHLAPEYLRAEIDRLQFGLSAEFSTRFLPAAENTISEGESDARNLLKNKEKMMVGATGFEPAASWSRSKNSHFQRVAARSSVLQTIEKIELTHWSKVQRAQTKAAISKVFSTGFLPENVSNGPANIEFLTVRAAARALKISTATVYDLCSLGELAHSRVANAIRISPAAIAEYLEAQRVETATLLPAAPTAETSLEAAPEAVRTGPASVAPPPPTVAKVLPLAIPPPPLPTQPRPASGWHELPRSRPHAEPAVDWIADLRADIEVG